MITMIAAVAENNALGKNNLLLWHLPDDFKRFKSITSNHYIIMGRKTFESFPKPLPNRTHVVITNQKKYKAPEGVIIVNNIQEALKAAQAEEEIFIIGGGEIYNQFLSLADKIELTHVHASFEADAFFPSIDLDQWNIVAEDFHDIDEKHAISFTYKTYERIISVSSL
jgi:dihydrofolate reductase